MQVSVTKQYNAGLVLHGNTTHTWICQKFNILSLMKRPSGERPWWTGGNTKERWTSESRNTVWDFQRGACWMLEVIPLVLMSSKMGQIWGGGDLLEGKWLNLRGFFFVNGSYAHGVSCSHTDLCSVSVGMFQKCSLFHSLKTQMLSPNNTWRDATVFLSAWMKKILLDFRQGRS